MKSLSDYFYATRPWSFPCIFAPAFVTLALAYDAETFETWVFVETYVFLLAAHILGNLANAYFDFVSGNDADKKGKATGDRFLLDGVMTLGEIKGMMYISAAVMVGTAGHLLVHFSDDEVLEPGVRHQLLTTGIIGALISVFYTAPPISFKLHALGEVCLFLCFGVLPITGAYTLLTHGSWDLARTLLPSLPLGVITAAVLHCNNTRDRRDDARMGGVTMAMLMGFERAYVTYILMIALAYALAFYEAYRRGSYIMLLPVLSLWKALNNIWMFRKQDLAGLDEHTAVFALFFGAPFALGLYLNNEYLL